MEPVVINSYKLLYDRTMWDIANNINDYDIQNNDTSTLHAPDATPTSQGPTEPSATPTEPIATPTGPIATPNSHRYLY